MAAVTMVVFVVVTTVAAMVPSVVIEAPRRVPHVVTAFRGDEMTEDRHELPS
ncbi:hypothetical protein [Streptomyces sp. NBC_00057]|uniref:hypothetical protein n=1 Tax=Streptomyces sp. NBC_00057 TaxID=2975634 RepID=UPI003244407E